MEIYNLFIKHNTDKGSNQHGSSHGYSFVYEKYFQPLKNESIKLLEIGIANGGSLKSWYVYFQKAEIIGIDINESKHIENDRIKTFKGHQGIRGHLRKFINEFGGDFDVIIDDGSHFNNDISTSLGHLYPYLKSGGLYFIEDLQAWDIIKVAPLMLNLLRNFQETGKFKIDALKSELDPRLPNTITNEEAIFIENNTKKCQFYCGEQLFVLEKN